MRIAFAMRLLFAILLVTSVGCQRSQGSGDTSAPDAASAPRQAGGEPTPAPATPSSSPPRWDRPPVGSLPLEPGKRLGEVSIGMTREELVRIFPDQVVKGIEQVRASPDKTIEFLRVDGRYEVKLQNGRVHHVGVKLADFKHINYGGKVLNSGLTLEQMAELLPGCKEHDAIGATGFNCTGVNVIRGGISKLPQANVSVGVFSVELAPEQAREAAPGAIERPAAGAQARKPFAEKMVLEPGRRLGEIDIGMSREELVRRFPDRTVRGIEQVFMSPDKSQEFLTAGGMYKVHLINGRVSATSAVLAEFRTIAFNDELLNSGLTMKQMADMLPDCRALAVDGASGFTCAGVEVVRGGVPKLPQAGVTVAVFAAE